MKQVESPELSQIGLGYPWVHPCAPKRKLYLLLGGLIFQIAPLPHSIRSFLETLHE